jgi:predicted DNA-binding transcriptional regulator AlpA
MGIKYSPTTIRKMVKEKRFPPWHECSSTRLHVWPAEKIHAWLSGEWKPEA